MADASLRIDLAGAAGAALAGGALARALGQSVLVGYWFHRPIRLPWPGTRRAGFRRRCAYMSE